MSHITMVSLMALCFWSSRPPSIIVIWLGLIFSLLPRVCSWSMSQSGQWYVLSFSACRFQSSIWPWVYLISICESLNLYWPIQPRSWKICVSLRGMQVLQRGGQMYWSCLTCIIVSLSKIRLDITFVAAEWGLLMPEISAYHRDIGVQMPDLSICTLKCELRDYYSDMEIMIELGNLFSLRTLGGLISKLQQSSLRDQAIFINVEVVKGGHSVDYKWNEFLG